MLTTLNYTSKTLYNLIHYLSEARVSKHSFAIQVFSDQQFVKVPLVTLPDQSQLYSRLANEDSANVILVSKL